MRMRLVFLAAGLGLALVATALVLPLAPGGRLAPHDLAGSLDAPTPAETLARDFVAGKAGAGDLQGLVVRAAALAGVSVQATTYQHDLGAGSLEAATLAMYDALGIQADADVRAQLHDGAAGVDPALADAAARILFASAEAQATMAKQVTGLAPGDFKAIYDCGRLGPADPGCDGPRALAAAQGTDRAGAMRAALGVLSAAQQALPALRDAAAKGPAPTDADGSTIPIFEDPLRLVQIGGTGRDTYLGNLVQQPPMDARAQVLTIDLGGDDRYADTAGGTAPNPPPGDNATQAAGNGTLQATQLDAPVTVAGPLVSVTIDLAGNDTYSCLVGCQGSGTLGVGLLLDLGGDDHYQASSTSQGYGLLGLGMLFDAQGDDQYTGDVRVQGFGATGGVGLLLDAGGQDAYVGQQMVQGVGASEGAGLLLDATGDDAYDATYQGWAISQGASYQVGTGVLADAQGADTYVLVSGGRGWIQPLPAPYMVGVAVFLDGQGNDSYTGSPGANGSDWSQGVVGHGSDEA